MHRWNLGKDNAYFPLGTGILPIAVANLAKDLQTEPRKAAQH